MPVRWGLNVRELRALAAVVVATAMLTLGTFVAPALARSLGTTSPACAEASQSSVSPSVTTLGTLGGLMPPRPALTSLSCGVASTPRLAGVPPLSADNNSPPLLINQGVVTDTTGPVTITPIFWAPSGFTYPSNYQSLVLQFLNDIAAASGTTSNVFSVLTQYSDTHGNYVKYSFTTGAPIVDTTSYPTVGSCTPDSGEVYADGTGYSACLTDTQIISELATVLNAQGLPSDLNHLYLVFLPKGVESCYDTSNDALGGTCTLSSAGGSFCGYHSDFTQGSKITLYADLPYAVVDNPINTKTCSSDAGALQGDVAVGNQSPNNNIDADTEINIASHEISESITDPMPTQGWADSSGNEVADDCEYIYGDSSTFQGAPGAEFNEVINGHEYFLQEEFSNGDFALNPANGCAQRSDLATNVVFNANGGSGTMLSETASIPTVLSTNTFVRAGYVFTGWNTSAAGTGTAYAPGALYNFASSVTLYAQWRILATSVTFNGDGGTGTMLTESASTPTALSANSFVRAGYVFAGWNTSAAGTGTTFAPGALYDFTSSVTLYAQWTLRAPASPTRVDATDVNGSLTLHWKAPSPSTSADVLGYKIFEGTTADFIASVPVSGADLVTRTSFKLVNLIPNVHYYFKVEAVNASGSSPGSANVRVTRNKSATTLRIHLSVVSISFASQHDLSLFARVSARYATEHLSGVVTFRAGSTALCTAVVNSQGTARCRLGSRELNRGAYVVVANFAGSAFLARSSSNDARMTIH